MHYFVKFCSFLLLFQIAYPLKCRDEEEEEVDWYYLYKLPKLEDKSEPFNTGYAYAFMTSREYKNGWNLSEQLITDEDSIFAQTLEPLYKKRRKKYSYLLYSDQPAEGSDSTSYGHTKGVLAMDENTGFWLIHSVPKFPALISKSKYKYPTNGRENGQTALCISFKTKTQANKIVYQLLYNQPKIYEQSVSGEIKKIVPNFEKLLDRKWLKNKRNKLKIKSDSSMEFISFARGKIGEDLYGGFVAPSLESSLYVETWRRGAGTPVESECKAKYQTVNVEIVTVSGMQWNYVEDHSKWAITEPGDESKDGYVCIGDLNRMKSQFNRAGGTVCLKQDSVWRTFRNSIIQLEACAKHTASVTSSLKLNETSDSSANVPMQGTILMLSLILFVVYCNCLGEISTVIS